MFLLTPMDAFPRVNLKCSSNSVFNQCINEQHAKYLPNILRFELNLHKQRKTADFEVRLELGM